MPKNNISSTSTFKESLLSNGKFSANASTTKPKSTLQIELEKFAAEEKQYINAINFYKNELKKLDEDSPLKELKEKVKDAFLEKNIKTHKCIPGSPGQIIAGQNYLLLQKEYDKAAAKYSKTQQEIQSNQTKLQDGLSALQLKIEKLKLEIKEDAEMAKAIRHKR